ncbi:hypothetical protein Mapa_006230 [Marchantia paleacea]|nr:hypothetical protein Mapa_006230 [Marchantia paleacea]
MQCQAFPPTKDSAKQEEAAGQSGDTFWCWWMEFCQCRIYWETCEGTVSSADGLCGGTEPWRTWAGFCCWKGAILLSSGTHLSIWRPRTSAARTLKRTTNCWDGSNRGLGLALAWTMFVAS